MNEGRRTRPDLLLLVAVLGLLVVGIVMVYSASFIIAHNEFGDENYFLTRHLIFLTPRPDPDGLPGRCRYQRWASLGLAGRDAGGRAADRGARAGAGRGELRVSKLCPPDGRPCRRVSSPVSLRRWPSSSSWPPGCPASIVPPRASRRARCPSCWSSASSPAWPRRSPIWARLIVVVLAASTVFWVAGANVLHVGSVARSAASAWRGWPRRPLTAPGPAGLDDLWADPQGLGWQARCRRSSRWGPGLPGSGSAPAPKGLFPSQRAHRRDLRIVGEELGLLGTVLVLVLFAVIAWRGLTIALGARDTFGQLLAVGVTSLIVWQALLNMMVCRPQRRPVHRYPAALPELRRAGSRSSRWPRSACC